MIYLSPATLDESAIDSYNNSVSRQVLLDPSLNGFFYRTDFTVIEQWQLWDDVDSTGIRPRPPASPFGQNQGLYHDDLTGEIQQYLRHMDMEEHSSSSSRSTSSSECRRRHHRSPSKSNTLTKPFALARNSSFDPTTIPLSQPREQPKPPIIIEKILPNTLLSPRSPYALDQPHEILDDEPYSINEHGERISREGNRLVYMDVIRPLDSQSTKIHRKRSKKVPVLDLRSLENLFHQSEHHQRSSDSNHLEIVEGYFEDAHGRKMKLNGNDAQTVLERFETSNRHHSSTITSGPDINYVERPSQLPSIEAPVEQPTIKPEDMPDIMSPFRYMQSSVNPLLLREYRHLFFNTVQ